MKVSMIISCVVLFMNIVVDVLYGNTHLPESLNVYPLLLIMTADVDYV